MHLCRTGEAVVTDEHFNYERIKPFRYDALYLLEPRLAHRGLLALRRSLGASGPP